MAFDVPFCSDLYSKPEIRQHLSLSSFFLKWGLLPGVQGLGKDLRVGMCHLQGISWSVGAEYFPAWFPVLSHLVFASG